VNKKAYPPAFFDRAAENFPIKQKILRNLFHAKNSQLVSCAKWLTHELELAHFDNVKTITNSIDQEFLTALQNVEINSVKDNLFVCRDLRDNRKIDWDLLEKISRVSNQTLTIVGDNPPFHLPNVNYVSALNDRFALANIYRSHKRLIFTSKVDHFPLTIAEALASGLEVYALFSKAAMEFADYPKCFIFNSSEELFKELCEKGNSKIVNKYLPSAPNIDFLPEAMTRKYEEIYLGLTNR
jgi:putative colanic acid biosynthesis glycosyltransferase